MNQCKGFACSSGRRSIRADPLDACGEQSELEMESGRLINPPRSPASSSRLRPRPKSRCKEKEETEKRRYLKSCHEFAATPPPAWMEPRSLLSAHMNTEWM